MGAGNACGPVNNGVGFVDFRFADVAAGNGAAQGTDGDTEA